MPERTTYKKERNNDLFNDILNGKSKKEVSILYMISYGRACQIYEMMLRRKRDNPKYKKVFTKLYAELREKGMMKFDDFGRVLISPYEELANYRKYKNELIGDA